MIDVRTLAGKLLRENMGYQHDQPLTIVFDETTHWLAGALRREALADNCSVLRTYNLDDNKRPLKDIPEGLEGMLKGAERDARENKTSHVLFMAKRTPQDAVVDGQTVTEVSFTRALSKRVLSFSKFGNLPEITPTLLASAYDVRNDPSFSAKLFEYLKTIQGVHITTEMGTDVLVTFDHEKHPFWNSDGIAKVGTYCNPIPAEVYTYPARVEGRIVLDATYSALGKMERFKGQPEKIPEALARTPITWVVENDSLGGRITNVLCDDKEMLAHVNGQVFVKKDWNRIGEIGFPANIAILEGALTGSTLLDEKGRVHFANGGGYPPNNPPYEHPGQHCDGLLEKPTITVFGEPSVFVMKHGKYVF